MVPFNGKYGMIMREMANDVLRSASFKENTIFNQQEVVRLLDNFEKPTFLASKQLMSILMFELWRLQIFETAGTVDNLTKGYQ